MSLYRRCSDALDDLIARPPKETGGLFTEFDVVRKAGLSDWTEEDFKEALKQANQICGTAYRARKLARFGPVDFNGHEDYGRIATKIAYAPADRAPDFWETPNGKFPRLMIEDDSIIKQGRKHGNTRNDLVPWNKSADRELVKREPSVVDKSRIHQLEADLRAAITRAENAEKEASRLRSHKAKTKVNGNGGNQDQDFLGLLEDLMKRVDSLEDRERRREQIYEEIG